MSSSKQFESIASQYANRKAKDIVSGTSPVQYVEKEVVRRKEQKSRVVASVPLSLKTQLEQYIKAHPGETEQALVIKGLKLLGFDVDSSWLVDKRTVR